MQSNRPPMLPRHALGGTGLEVSLLGFGAEAIGRPGRSFEDAERTLNAVVDLGVTLIDTAAAYGNSEEFIGRALHARHKRGEFVLVTKCGWTGDYEAAWSPREIADTIDRSLKRLQTDCVDVLLLHSCDLDTLKAGEVIEAVQRARDAGKAQFIGYSGDNEALAFAIDSGAFDAVECSFSMLDQANAAAIERAAAKDVGVILKRPLANAVPGATSKPRSEYAAQYWPRWQQIALGAADVQGVPWLETALRFSAYHPGVSSALIGSSHAEHMRQNARALEAGPLPAQAIKRIREAFARAGGDWPALG